MNARDIAIRTILGEAANESPMGQAAVAHVLLNRAADPRWPSTIHEVALQPKQFSAWNSGAGGNDLVSKYGPGSDPYEKVGAIYDAVASGQVADPTGGATHYYSPAGMQALVDQGAQSNLIPAWLAQENAARNGQVAQIGGHIFTGQVNAPQGVGLPGVEVEEDMAWLDRAMGIQDAAQQYFAPPPEAPQIQPMQTQQAMMPARRDTTQAYRSLFEGLFNA